MPQFFINKIFAVGSEVEIRGADARHIAQVLRLAAGDWIVLSDGEGRSYRAEIRESSPRKIRATVLEEIARPKALPPPALALALIKGDRFEWAIQKAVELGIRRIIPFRSARTVPQPVAGDLNKKLARWQKIALEAAKQSGLPHRPAIDLPLDFSALCDLSKAFDRTVLFYEGRCPADIRSWWRSRAGGTAPPRDLLIVGPEGGFTADEVALAERAGAAPVSLGAQILRVETAAVAALAIWQYELGNMAIF